MNKSPLELRFVEDLALLAGVGLVTSEPTYANQTVRRRITQVRDAGSNSVPMVRVSHNVDALDASKWRFEIWTGYDSPYKQEAAGDRSVFVFTVCRGSVVRTQNFPCQPEQAFYPPVKRVLQMAQTLAIKLGLEYIEEEAEDLTKVSTSIRQVTLAV